MHGVVAASSVKDFKVERERGRCVERSLAGRVEGKGGATTLCPREAPESNVNLLLVIRFTH
jgi:hypothetical protein